jgi:hypothetical protein
MGADKTLRRLLSGSADAAIRSDDLCHLLENLSPVSEERRGGND